jgi:uncharacterized Zn-binding protein involved in type VI secretion
MAAVAYVGVPCSGHDCFPPRISEASTNTTVFMGVAGVGTIPMHVYGDVWPLHECAEEAHTGIIVSGSSRTFINGQPIARMGDGIGGLGCASIISAGSDTVYCGG